MRTVFLSHWRVWQLFGAEWCNAIAKRNRGEVSPTVLPESISPIDPLIRVVQRCLIPLLAFAPLLAAQQVSAAQGAIQVQVIEGDGLTYPAGSRATRGITALVADESGRPVDGAIVGFRLPDDGPGGVFATGAKTEIVTTRADGRASVWAMRWNRVPGPFEIRITAAKGPMRAVAICQQSLAPPASSDASSKNASARGHKWLWITLAVAGAAAGGIAVAELAGKSGSGSAATSTTGVQIGAPSISLGVPPP